MHLEKKADGSHFYGNGSYGEKLHPVLLDKRSADTTLASERQISHMRATLGTLQILVAHAKNPIVKKMPQPLLPKRARPMRRMPKLGCFPPRFPAGSNGWERPSHRSSVPLC